MTQQWNPTGGRFDVEPLENINEVADLPDLAQLDEAQIYSIRSGNFAPDYVVPWAWDASTEEYQEWRSTVDGQVIRDIPDSAIHQLKLDEDSSTFADSIGSEDATNQGTSRVTGDYLGGAARSGDGSDQYIEWTSLGDFGSNMDSDFAVLFTVETTDDEAVLFGTRNDNNNTRFNVSVGRFDSGSGQLEVMIQDEGTETLTVYTNNIFNDGDRYRVCVNKTANSASGIEIWVNASEESVNTGRDENFASPINYQYPMALFAENIEGSVGDHMNANLDNIIVTDDSITDSDIGNDYNAQPWS